MKHMTILLSSSAVLLAACGGNLEQRNQLNTETTQTMADTIAPPVAKRIDKVTEQVGRTRTDPYAWIRDDNWQEVMQDPSVLNADIRAYLEAENAYTKDALETPTEGLAKTLFEEMKGRIKEDDSSVPAIDGAWAYYRKFREGGEYAIYARKPADKAFDEDARRADPARWRQAG